MPITGELIPVLVNLRNNTEYIGLVLDGQQKTDEWMRLERAVRLVQVPSKDDPGEVGLLMMPLAKSNQYLGYVDLHPNVLAVVTPLDTKGSIYRQYQEAVTGLTMPPGVGEGMPGMAPSVN